MFCNRCGAKIADDSQFCPACGQKVAPASTPAQESSAPSPVTPPTPQQPVKKKKRGCGCLILWILLGFIIALVVVISNLPDAELTSEQWLEFDTQSWSDYQQLLQNHNNFLSSLTAYSNGQVDATTFYATCQQYADVFGNNATCYNYGKNKYQKDYLDPYARSCIDDKDAAKSLMKYLDSHQTSDLASAQDNITRAQGYLVDIASNRGALLAEKTDLTNEQIQQRVNETTSAE